MITMKMSENKITSLEKLRKFFGQPHFDPSILELSFQSKKDSYTWISKVLTKFKYKYCRRKDKTIIRRYIRLVTNYSRQQLDRLIKRHAEHGIIETQYNKRPNSGRYRMLYTKEEIKLMAETDDLHNYPSGQALRKIMNRMYRKFGRKEFKRIRNISVSHIYNIRNTRYYRRIARNYTKTKPNMVMVTIGDRGKPDPQGKPGYLRIDTVHQGIHNGKRSIYHINAIDEVLQYEVVLAVPEINETYMLPMLETMLNIFPFKIVEFHSDNGSEFVNKKVLALLNRLKIRFSRSRPRKHNDNALVEGKNGAIIRKHIGYGFINPKTVRLVNEFYLNYFIPYLNYHRPCAYPDIIRDEKTGKIKRMYPKDNYFTPYEKLKGLPDAQRYLKDGVSFEELDKEAYKYDDNEMAMRMKRAKRKLLEIVELPDLHTIDIVKLLKLLKKSK